MTSCKIARLNDRGLIRVSGADAKKFLQDIVTNDVTKAVDGKAVHAALLTPQGKILFDFFLLDRGGHYLLECAKELADDLIKRLTFYKLRAAVELEDLSGSHAIYAVWNGEPDVPETVISYADPRHAPLGWRLITPASMDVNGGCEVASEADYHAHRISLGIPDSGQDYALGETFPHEADYDQLGTVDFKKGCYVGQEVVGRMKHRGTARTRIVPVRADTPLSPGTEIFAGDATIGSTGSVSGNTGLAMVRLDRAEKAYSEGNALMAGETEIELIKPDWADFDVPQKDNAA